MKRMKRVVMITIVLMLVIPSFLITADANQSKHDHVISKQDGVVAAKDEVVYATLHATGDQKEIYVVNMLDVSRAGKIVDHGAYTSLKNLTDLSELVQKDNEIQISAPEGKFYYQGDLTNTLLPWKFIISYTLDGKAITPKELAGKDGHLEIKIKTSANKKVDQTFFEHYLLQVSLPFDSEMTGNIKAEDGMIANAGKNQQVTFSLMPGQEKELVVEADVEDFELAGIDITGVPSTMSIDIPDTEDMTGDMKTLTGAIAHIDDGVAQLKNGVAQLHGGVAQLEDGSAQYQAGVTKLAASSSELVDGSKEIDKALEMMSSSLDGLEDMDVTELARLGEGLAQIAGGLKETAGGLSTLKENYHRANHALDAAMSAIPAGDINNKEIAALKNSNANQAVVEKLLETYTASQTAKGTYAGVKQAFYAVEGTLGNVTDSLNNMADNVHVMVSGLSTGDMGLTNGLPQLQKGLARLSKEYKTFHSGLLSYTGGVEQLANSYENVHDGIGELAEGTSQLEKGAVALHSGTTELAASTRDLPKEMEEEIDQMMDEYVPSDFDAVSFVSDKNDVIDSVQFVLKTEGIQVEESETAKEPVKEAKGFWARLKDLFL